MKLYTNKDKTLWKKSEDPYDPYVFVTEDGQIGIACGGKVFVKDIEDWHYLAREKAGSYKRCKKCGRIELDDGMSLPKTKCANCGSGLH